jgi:redox-sensitive bicupin YhaK (pirin superfamily)
LSSSLVFGASGGVGRFLLPRLAARGERVFAVSRAPPVDANRQATWLRGDLGVLSRNGDKLRIQAPVAAGAILVAGRPLNEPVAKYGPFVMNTREQIVQAVDDFRAGRF